jgi:Lsr2
VAIRRVLTRVDDLDGSPDAHPVRFGLDGRQYEIDLTDAHAHQFRELLARTSRRDGASPGAAAPTSASTWTPESPPKPGGANADGATDKPPPERDHLPRSGRFGAGRERRHANDRPVRVTPPRMSADSTPAGACSRAQNPPRALATSN